MKTGNYQSLSTKQAEQLESQGCTAEDWTRILVTVDFLPERVQHVHFAGTVKIGDLQGSVQMESGLDKPAGVYRGYISNCTIGNGVRIASVHSHVANYAICDGACIEDVGTLETSIGAKFGNGVEVEALNEGGGREVTLFNELSAQFAYLQCLVRFRPKLVDRLNRLTKSAVAAASSDIGTVGRNARITSVPHIANVNIGDAAMIHGAESLINGTVLSCDESPTFIGTGVVAEDFIFAEGANVDSGAIVCKSYVGQGCQIAKQFSSENSLFFVNSEGFHGEACNIFAGPYTVTHHKSTLLVAGLFSFFNAGSGTNQSNHMYKLGPVHEGKMERGCKTGSFSYIMWPCCVGPFSVVLGKHTRTFDTRDFPFSHIEAKSNGRCEMVPGLYLSTVGTVRDGAKWPTRDRRRVAVNRDIVDFDVFSPLTVGRMLRGTEKLRAISESSDAAKDVVAIDGAEVRRVLLRKGIRFYEAGIEMYLLERLLKRLEDAGTNNPGKLAASDAAVFSEQWIDLAGQMMPKSRFEQLCTRIESSEIESASQLHAELSKIHESYEEDEWAWVTWAYKTHFGKNIAELSADEARSAAQSWGELRSKVLNLILGDAEKEFQPKTRTGFGLLDCDNQRDEDFNAVRGTFEENKFVKKIRKELAEVARRVELHNR